MVEKKVVESAVAKALELGKGKRKFTQSVDLAINFRDVDFKKPENRINVDVILPHPSAQAKIAVFADGQLALDAKNAGADLVVAGADIPSYAADTAKRESLGAYSILASPQLMATVGKSLGQFLSARGKLPKPILPNANLKDLITRTRSTITVRSKGKYLPVVHCGVGKETQSTDELSENILAVFEGVERKIPESQIASAYVKTTMGASAKLI